jgi:hypothetical protein
MAWMDWYNSLAKPSWTPAPSTISLIWMILYPIILISFGFVFVQAFRGKVPWKRGSRVQTSVLSAISQPVGRNGPSAVSEARPALSWEERSTNPRNTNSGRWPSPDTRLPLEWESHFGMRQRRTVCRRCR